MLNKFKKYYLLFLVILLILFIIPYSFATDSSSEVLTSDNHTGDEGFIEFTNDDINISEGQSATVEGTLYWYDGMPCYDDLNVYCNYTDGNNINRSYITLVKNSELSFDLSQCEGLTASSNPYILTFSPVKDDNYGTYLLYSDGLVNSQVKLRVNSNQHTENIIYVFTTGNDITGNGSLSNPYATISKALNENSALGGNKTILIKEGTYTLSDYYLSNNVKIIGEKNVIIKSNTGKYHLLIGGNAKNVTLENLTFINGSGNSAGSISMVTTAGGSGNNGKYLTINNCNFINNKGSVGAITTYAVTKITNCNFINNIVTGYSYYFQGVISSRDNNLTISYCNFINNTGKSNKGVYADNNVNVIADYNYWGSNNKPNSSYVSSNINVNKWSIITITLNNTNNIGINDKIKCTIDFTKYTDGNTNYTLNNLMPKINITGNTLHGSLEPNSIITNDLEEIIYTAKSLGEENISFKHLNMIKSFIFNIGSQYTGIVYVTTNGSDLNSGNITSPVATISKAIEIATADGGSNEIIILNGKYNECNIEILKDVTISGDENTIISGNREVFNIKSGIIKLNRLTLNTTSINGSIINNGNLTIRKSTILNNDSRKIAIKNTNILDIAYSNIVNTIIENTGNVVANYNWWGTNSKPTSVDVDNWVVMNVSPDFVYNKESSNITVSLNTLNTGDIINELPLRNLTLVVNGNCGVLNITGNILLNGSTTINFNGNNKTGSISAIIDCETINITVVNAIYYWFIEDKGYRTLELAVNAAKENDIIKGIPGTYIIDEVRVGHRYMPIEPWEVNKTITITSLQIKL